MQYKDLSKKQHVRRLEVFGSGMREDYGLQRSDLDLLVEIDTLETSSYFDDHFNLSEGQCEHASIGNCEANPVAKVYE